MLLYVTPNTVFYDVMKHWYKVMRTENSQINVLEQSLWFNSNIRQNKIPISSKKWADKGILTVKDIVENANIVSFPDLKTKFN